MAIDTEIMEEVGFTKGEIKVYVTLLELGPATAGRIIEKSRQQNSVVHFCLNKLIKKGIVTYVKKGKARLYNATDPKNIVQYIEDKKKKFETLLPELLLKQKMAKEEQTVELFEGKKGLYNLYSELLKNTKKGDEYLSFAVGEEHKEKDVLLFHKNLTQKRKERELKIRVIGREKVRKLFFKLYGEDIMKTINCRFTDFNFPQGLIICKNKIAIVTWTKKPTGILVKSKFLAQKYRDFFYDVYNKAKP